ncbi:hypothetical protein GW17_00024301 [Ensete ventricosum]|nr:hypothetical protein GW17_00024301 [Ensete ventricosum]
MLLKRLRLGMQFCDALFYGVVVVDFEDAVAGSCAKKATIRCPLAGFRVADGDEISNHRNLLERDMPVRRDGLSFDNEEGAAEEQMAGKDTVGAGGHCWGVGGGIIDTVG